MGAYESCFDAREVHRVFGRRGVGVEIDVVLFTESVNYFFGSRANTPHWNKFERKNREYPKNSESA